MITPMDEIKIRLIELKKDLKRVDSCTFSSYKTKQEEKKLWINIFIEN